MDPAAAAAASASASTTVPPGDGGGEGHHHLYGMSNADFRAYSNALVAAMKEGASSAASGVGGGDIGAALMAAMQNSSTISGSAGAGAGGPTISALNPRAFLAASISASSKKKRKLSDQQPQAAEEEGTGGNGAKPAPAAMEEDGKCPAAVGVSGTAKAAAAAAAPPRKPLRSREEDEKAWQLVLEQLPPRCTAQEGIRDTSSFLNNNNKFQQPSYHHHSSGSGSGSGNNKGCLKKLLQELDTLEDSLPTYPAIWLRFDEETPQYLRAMITAPPGTPYSYGLFCFDLFVPDQYPSVPPKVKLLTTGGGTVGFSPNLYPNGTVCLSLLGTWHGPKWNPMHSSLLQVLVSIQGLILGVEHPYFLEPGHGGWGETSNSHHVTAMLMKTDSSSGKMTPLQPHVKVAEDRYREGTLKYALLETLRAKARYLVPFQDVIAAHFAHYRDAILQEAHSWVSLTTRRGTKSQMQQTLTRLEQELNELEKKCGNDDGDVKASAANTKKPAKGEGEEAASKQKAMEEAASKGDYIRAGQLLRELQYLRGKDTVGAMIEEKRQRMETAAREGDYIEAGTIQASLKDLEKFKKRLQDLQRRMYEAAAKDDFVRAGHFQEQYRILIDATNEASSSSSGVGDSTSAAAAGKNYPAGLSQILHKLPPPYGNYPYAEDYGHGYDPVTEEEAYYDDHDEY